MPDKHKDRDFDEISSLLKTVCNHFDKEDRMTRERQIRHWRRLKLYWANFSQIYWSEVALMTTEYIIEISTLRTQTKIIMISL